MSSADESAILRKAQIIKNIRQALEHPLASLLFAIGAERSSPNSAAREAYVLGLPGNEEKLAKWVGILKRDAEKFFWKAVSRSLAGDNRTRRK